MGNYTAPSIDIHTLDPQELLTDLLSSSSGSGNVWDWQDEEIYR